MPDKHIRYLLLLFLSLVFIAALPAKAPRYTRLEPGEIARGVIRADGESPRFRTYMLDVPVTATAVRIRILESEADLDLYLRRGSAMEDYSQADFYADSDDWLEEVHLYKAYETQLLPGRYYLDVTYQWKESPRRNGVPFSEIPYALELEIFDGRDARVLVPGVPVESVLDDSGVYMAQFSLEVPLSAESFRIDVLDTPGDVDLFLSRENPASLRDEYDRIADSYIGRESLLVDRMETAVDGTWYLTVLEASETDYPVALSLVATLGSGVPASAPSAPVSPSGEAGIGRLREATVQLLSPSGIGSGCLVSPDGHILTNHHVVTDNGGRILENLVVAVSFRPNEAPVEAFLAEVLETSPDDDLALLKIASDRWGRALPRGYRFPSWILGDPGELDTGESLLLMGYPWMGSGLSRSHFTLTEGILSGGERTPSGLIYKTDAVISGGSSGGAVSNGEFRLLGLPSFVVSDEAAQLTYFVPVDRIPRDWRHLFQYE